MWNLSSRAHKLNCFPDNEVACYVKRDDELGCGISGSKLRKYAGLVPFFCQKKIRRLLIIAGPQSNNLLAALQVARELQLEVTAFLIKPRNLVIQGNFKLSLLFLSEQEIVWVEREEWPQVMRIAQDHLNALKEPGFILNEGASVPEALVGAMSMANDIIINENNLGLVFQHIFVDAGTGFSAAALIHGLAQTNHLALIHVLLLADEERTFNSKLHDWIGAKPNNYCCFYPSNAKSFGAVNQTVKDEIKRLAREEGILADPIYSAKLFHEARRRIETERIKGNVLIIHSGGVLTLPGYPM